MDLLAALGHKADDPEVRAAALAALGKLADLRGLQVMTIGVRDSDVTVRVAAVHALGNMTNDVAFAAIAGALADSDAGVRGAAAETLAAGRGSAVTTDALVQALNEEADVGVRRSVALALGKLEDERARRRLVAALAGEPEAAVRLAALSSLDAGNGSKLQILRVAGGVQNLKVTLAGANRTLLHSPILPEAALPFAFCSLGRSAPLGLG